MTDTAAFQEIAAFLALLIFVPSLALAILSVLFAIWTGLSMVVSLFVEGE